MWTGNLSEKQGLPGSEWWTETPRGYWGLISAHREFCLIRLWHLIRALQGNCPPVNGGGLESAYIYINLDIFRRSSNISQTMPLLCFLLCSYPWPNRIQHFELLIKHYNILFRFLFPRSLIVVNYQNRQKSFPYEVQTPHQVVIISFTTRTHTCCWMGESACGQQASGQRGHDLCEAPGQVVTPRKRWHELSFRRSATPLLLLSLLSSSSSPSTSCQELSFRRRSRGWVVGRSRSASQALRQLKSSSPSKPSHIGALRAMKYEFEIFK